MESNSITNQRNLLDAYISRTPEFAGVEVVEFCDDGWSGKNFERPDVQELLTQARQGKIQCILVKDMSRFGRDYLIVGNYISRVFPFLGVRFISINDGIDSIRPTDIDSLDTSFRALLYDLYSRDLSRKVRSALRLRAEHGAFICSHAPYGYLKNPDRRNHVIIDPPAAEVVRRIFRIAADGDSAIQIARTLNQEGISTRMLYKQAAGCGRTVWNCVHEENFWTDTAVRKIIRDERYLGKVVFGKRYYDIIGKHHSIKIHKKDWFVVENTHETIVTQEESDHAQAMLKQFMERNGRAGTEVLRGKVRCGICGHTMAHVKRKKSYYTCRTPILTDQYACPAEPILEEDILCALIDSLRVQVMAEVERKHIWEERHQHQKADKSALQKRLSMLNGTLGQLKQQIKEMYERFALGEISLAEYRATKDAFSQHQSDTDAQISKLETELAQMETDNIPESSFTSAFQKYEEIQELSREIVAGVLKEITIYPGSRLEITWNYGNQLTEAQ